MTMLTCSTRPTYRTLLDAAALAPDGDERVAIVYLQTDQEPIVIARRDFRRTALAYAAALHKMGVAPRDLVVIAHTQDLESIHAFWGAMLAGAIPSMFPTLTEKLDADIYMRSMAELARLSDVRAILTTDEFAPVLSGHVPCPVYGSAQLTSRVNVGDMHQFTPRLPDPDQIAFLQHSSGTPWTSGRMNPAIRPIS